MELEALFDKKEISKILKKIPELNELKRRLEKVNYLTNLKIVEEQEMFIYKIYEPIMNVAATSSRPFTDFT